MDNERNPIGTVHGAEVNFSTEYSKARELMGTKGTDLERLMETCALMYLNCPEWMANDWRALIDEIERRQLFDVFKDLGLSTGGSYAEE